MERPVSVSIIEKAVAEMARQNSHDAEVARSILLNDERRPHYDRVYCVLKVIGEVRASVGLSNGPNWVNSGCADFDGAATPRPQSERRRDESGKASSSRLPGQLSGICVSLFIVLVVAGIVISERNQSWSAPSPPPSQSASTMGTGDGRVRNAGSGSNPEAWNTPTPEDRRRERVESMVRERASRHQLDLDPDSVSKLVNIIMLDEAVVPLPETGVLAQEFRGHGVAPLEIKTSGGENYYVKVMELETGEDVLTAFIRGGQHFEALLPLGVYEIRYATGYTWFGPLLDFGDRASYSRCDDRFEFKRTLSGYSGYTIELIKQVNGNLETEVIKGSDF